MTREERQVLEEISGPGVVPPKTFVSRRYVVAWCVRNGWLEWERKNLPRANRATALRITEAGRAAIQQKPNHGDI